MKVFYVTSHIPVQCTWTSFHQWTVYYNKSWGPSWSCLYGSWIYDHLCNQCLSSLTLWVRIPLMGDVVDAKLCDKVCQWLATCQWFSLGTPVSSTKKTDCHDITEILLKVRLNTKILTLYNKSWNIHCIL